MTSGSRVIGRDFGATPMGGHLADASTGVCTCDEEMRELGIATINCPAHGLIAFCKQLVGREFSVRV